MEQIKEPCKANNTIQLLKIEEACALLNVKESWLRRQIFLKAIPYRKVGRLIRLEREELLKWLNQTHA